MIVVIWLQKKYIITFLEASTWFALNAKLFSWVINFSEVFLFIFIVQVELTVILAWEFHLLCDYWPIKQLQALFSGIIFATYQSTSFQWFYLFISLTTRFNHDSFFLFFSRPLFIPSKQLFLPVPLEWFPPSLVYIFLAEIKPLVLFSSLNLSFLELLTVVFVFFICRDIDFLMIFFESMPEVLH